MGILLYELIHSKVPFKTNTYRRYHSINNFIRCKEGIDKDIEFVILSCLHTHIDKRLSASQLLECENVKRLVKNYNLTVEISEKNDKSALELAKEF